MKMMRAKERYKVNNVITIIRVNFMQRRTHFTFLNSFFPPSIYNRIQKMLLFCQSEMRKRGATALQCPYSYTFSSIHPSKSFTLQPPTFYLYLHSSPKQKKNMYIHWRKYERAFSWWKNEKKFSKIVLLMFRIMALSLHTHQCRRRWWNIDDDRNNDFDDDTTMAISFLYIIFFLVLAAFLHVIAF